MNIDWRYQLWKAGVTITDKVSSLFFRDIKIPYKLIIQSYCFFAGLSLQCLVLYNVSTWQLQQLFLRGSSVGRGSWFQDVAHDFTIGNAQRQTACAHGHVADYCRLHIHCDCLQFLPQVLHTRRGRGCRQKMSQYADGEADFFILIRNWGI